MEHSHAAAARVCWRGCGGEGTSTDGVHTYMGAGYDPFCVRESEGLDHARRRVMCWNMCEGAGESHSFCSSMCVREGLWGQGLCQGEWWVGVHGKLNWWCVHMCTDCKGQLT